MTFLPPTFSGTVTRVIDGDTYCIEYQNKEYIVRIIGVDCFETRYSRKLLLQSKRNNLPISIAYQKGLAAQMFAENVLLGETVMCNRPPDSPDNDQHFRYLRKVSVQWNNKLTNFATLLTIHGHNA